MPTESPQAFINRRRGEECGASRTTLVVNVGGGFKKRRRGRRERRISMTQLLLRESESLWKGSTGWRHDRGERERQNPTVGLFSGSLSVYSYHKSSIIANSCMKIVFRVCSFFSFSFFFYFPFFVEGDSVRLGCRFHFTFFPEAMRVLGPFPPQRSLCRGTVVSNHRWGVSMKQSGRVPDVLWCTWQTKFCTETKWCGMIFGDAWRSRVLKGMWKLRQRRGYAVCSPMTFVFGFAPTSISPPPPSICLFVQIQASYYRQDADSVFSVRSI